MYSEARSAFTEIVFACTTESDFACTAESPTHSLKRNCSECRNSKLTHIPTYIYIIHKIIYIYRDSPLISTSPTHSYNFRADLYKACVLLLAEGGVAGQQQNLSGNLQDLVFVEKDHLGT